MCNIVSVVKPKVASQCFLVTPKEAVYKSCVIVILYNIFV